MKFFTIFLIILINIFSLNQKIPTVSPSIGTSKKGKCCKLNHSFLNVIQLNSLCNKDNSVEFEFMITSPSYSMCTVIQEFGLRDNQGKVYAGKTIQNIKTCPEIITVGSGYKFYLSFEKLDKNISSIDLFENKNQAMQTTRPNWKFWYWNNVSVSHCNL